MHEVKSLSERQEILKGMVEDKIRLKSRATEKYCDQILEEMKELEEKKSEEALLLVQKKHILMRYHNERYEARRLQGCSRGTRKEADLQDLLSFIQVMQVFCGRLNGSPESPRKMQDEEEAMREASWNVTGGK